MLKPVLGSQIQLGHPLANGLVGCWLMNEGSGPKVLDLSGNGNNLLFYNEAYWSSGPFGSSIAFDGSNDYIAAEDSVTLGLTGDLTLMIAFSATSLVGNDGGLISKSSNGSKFFGSTVNKVYEIGILNNILYFQVSDGATAEAASFDVSSYIDGKVHVVVGTFTPNGQYLYIDGVQKDSNLAIGITGPQAIVSTLNIGGWASATYSFSGKVHFATICTYALSAQEIAQLYIGPFGMFEEEM